MLAGAARWGEAGVDPIEDLEDWSELIFLKSGVAPTDVVMTVDAWRLLKKSPSFKDAIDNELRGGSSTAQLGATIIGGEGAKLKGSIGDLRIWTYADYYVDPADETEKAILPPFTVLLGSAGIEGVRHFGAIQDEEAGFASAEYWAKSWVEKDPARRILLMQSAPLVVPYRVNASFCATVR